MREADGFVEAADEALWIGNEVKRRPLVRHQPVPVHVELVALGFAAEDRVVVEHQTRHPRTGTTAENQRGRQSADPATDDHAVVLFARVDGIRRQRLEGTVANRVRVGEHRQRVTVRSRVVADAAGTIPQRVLSTTLREQGRRAQIRQQRTGSEQRTVEKVTARYALIESQRFVMSLRFRVRHGCLCLCGEILPRLSHPPVIFASECRSSKTSSPGA